MLRAGVRSVDPSFPAFFRYRRIGDDYLLTNLVGQWLFLTPEELRAFVEGRVEPGSELYQRLKERNFIRAEVDIDDLVARWRRRKRFLDYGPNLHVCVVTLRCNETCVYCHASRADMDAVHTDMSKETAEQMVDLAFESTSPWLTIEFQGGEPLVNYPVVRHVIEYAKEKNADVGKTLEFTMVTNLALMDEEKLDFLLANKVQICTSIDGPKALHDKQRKLPGGSAWDAAVHWIRRINERYAEMGLDTTLYHVEALPTVTRQTLDQPRALVDAYVELGAKAIFLRPVDPFGFAAKTADRIGFSRDRYLTFYREAVDYMLELNKQGTEILERYAAILLTKILQGEDPNFLDLRNPAGTGIGALAYNYDGKIFSSDEGRMLYEMGDDFFQIGTLGETTYEDLMRHETTRALTLASILEANPDCTNCAYLPYCGISPEYNYRNQGSLSGRMRESPWCISLKGIQDYLFEKLRAADEEERALFEKWTTIRPREHFLQGAAEAS
ncbi:MAG: His-Xaa-Ser system radical SAM maturase HxsB [Deltaproteobacteria bacterium]|nr:MAG: His-Xaa-Ser system radical SAM maturase HxsB [Deltaproteobacteria bacterium]